MKTIEEAATNAYSVEVLSSGCNAGVTFAKEIFKQGVEFAQRWIPISEELPKPYTFILCKCSLGDHYISCSNAKGEIISSKGETITHWRPIELK